MKLASVSAELKMARSLVRLTDIQATLKEQRILFIREQIRKLEESEVEGGVWNPPKNYAGGREGNNP